MRTRWRVITLLLATLATVLLMQHGTTPATELPASGTSASGTPSHPFDLPGEADKYFYAQRVYPFETLPADWAGVALDHAERMQKITTRRAGLSWLWVSMGPRNLAGRIRAMATDPHDFATVYAGSAGGGVWKSSDSGVRWRAQDDFLPNLRIGSVAVDPFDSRIVLAGNGEGFVAWKGGIAYGRGIYRSSDGGERWELQAETDDRRFEYVFSIAFDPAMQGSVLACTREGVFRSLDGGLTWQGPVLSFTGSRAMMTAFAADVPGRVYAALEKRGVHRSDDHGVTWSGPLNEGLPADGFMRIQLAVAPSAGGTLYAAFTANDQSCLGVFRSDDAGEHWRQVATPTNELRGVSYMASQGSYNSALRVHPLDPEVVWAGGVDLYRSGDGGTTWKQMSNWYRHDRYPYVHADIHEILINPDNTEEVLAATDGGMFRSLDGGSSFLAMDAGMVTVQFHSGTPHPYSDLVLGGTIDNGTLRVDDGGAWTDVTSGDGGMTAIDPGNPAVMYGELYFLHFLKSTDHGRSFRLRMEGIPRSGSYGTSDRVSFIAPFALHPAKPELLYAGTYRVYRSIDAAESWTLVSPALTQGVLTAIALCEGDERVIYAGSSIGEVFRSTDAGATWLRVSATLPNRYVTDFDVNPDDAKDVMVSLSGVAAKHVHRSTDGGDTWEAASGDGPSGLPDAPVSSIVRLPGDPATVFAGSDVGLFLSTDAGGTWMAATDGMGNVTVADLQFRRDGTLFVATHGRGMFRSNVPLTGDDPSQPSDVALSQSYPNPVSRSAGYTAVIPYTLATQAAVFLEVHDVSGRRVRRQSLGLQPPGSYHYPFDVRSLGSGLYSYRMFVNGRATDSRKMIVVR